MRRRTKYVYFFGDGKADGNARMKNLLGGKSAEESTSLIIGIPDFMPNRHSDRSTILFCDSITFRHESQSYLCLFLQICTFTENLWYP